MSLYNDVGIQTDEGQALAKDLDKYLDTVFEKWRALGYKTRDIASIAYQCVGVIENETVLRDALAEIDREETLIPLRADF